MDEDKLISVLKILKDNEYESKNTRLYIYDKKTYKAFKKILTSKTREK